MLGYSQNNKKKVANVSFFFFFFIFLEYTIFYIFQ